MAEMLTLNLNGFTYEDIYRTDTLPVLDQLFMDYLGQCNEPLGARFRLYRNGGNLAAVQESELLIEVARHVEDFLVQAFAVEVDRDALRGQQEQDEPVHAFKEKLVKPAVRRRRVDARPFEVVDACLKRYWDGEWEADPELAVARLWLSTRDGQQPELLALLEEWAWAAYNSSEGRLRTSGWVSFALPRKVEALKLVPTEPLTGDLAGRVMGLPERQRRRDGFGLTDPRFSFRQVMDQVNYCVYCHDHEGDFCSKGFPDREQGGFRSNALGVELTGCPLEEKISEAHTLKLGGYGLAALAVIMIDNPLLPATGHRICNDCMKSCIYQKQSPVDVPQIETRILTDVLGWEWGFEIYFLLTRWNPLNRERPYTQPYHGTTVMCVGTGPAGFNLSYHLLQAGFGVGAVDGLKIEPLPEAWTGGYNNPPQPIRFVTELNESLDERNTLGFGGVAEYGITVRWDKNFLKLVYLTLARNPYFRVYGGVRFGGTLTTEDAWALGFEHIALATGAGKPTVVAIKNNLARGIRQASDFLMALQLTGAAKRSSLANLQVRMPALVIGGGLSAIDTATEVQAYYIREVEKVLERQEMLVATQRWQDLTDSGERQILQEFLEHGRQVRAERLRAAANDEAPDFASLLRQWGGVTVTYRRGMSESPAYLRNHEEIDKALEEGIYYGEGLDPVEAVLDEQGHVAAVRFSRLVKGDNGAWTDSGESVDLPARSVFVAAGSSPNTVYNREHPGTFEMDGRYFATYQMTGDDAFISAPGVGSVKDTPAGFFTSYENAGRRISVYGDNHPLFQGSVVKAMASAKRGAREIIRLYRDRVAGVSKGTADWRQFAERLEKALRPRIAGIEQLGEHLTSITVHAPQAAQNWVPGQIYRLQNYHALASRIGNTFLQMEGMAIDGVDVDKEAGEIKLLVNSVGTSSRIAARLNVGEPVVLMGPTGTGLPMPQNSVITVMGGHSAVTSTIDGSAAWRAAGNRIIFIGHFRNQERARPVQAIMEILSDQAIWVLDDGPELNCHRPQDHCFVHGMEDFLHACQESAGTHSEWLMQSDCLVLSDHPVPMDQVANALRGPLRYMLKSDITAIAAVNSPMQCMMKEVCAQCLCRHHDPDTKQPSGVVFSCFNQHQPLFQVDFANLQSRQEQNGVLEKVSNQWLSFLLDMSEEVVAQVEQSVEEQAVSSSQIEE